MLTNINVSAKINNSRNSIDNDTRHLFFLLSVHLYNNKNSNLYFPKKEAMSKIIYA